MEKNKQNCSELAARIYDLDTEVYKCIGSSLGRTFTGDRKACIEDITRMLINNPRVYECRSQIALIGNMARTIKNKEDRKRMMTEYNEILNMISEIPESFGSVDILNENMGALNASNFRQNFSKDDPLIICIGRTHGSAGSDIAFALADKLKISYYDAEIFHQVLERMDAESDNIEDNNDFHNHAHMFKFNDKRSRGLGKFLKNFSKYHGLPIQDAVFFNQSDLICDMAKNQNFIVLGRCADVILTNKRIPHISIFITASFEERVRRMMTVHHLDYKHAARMLKKLDRQHEHYYNYYTGRKWGDAVNYDLCINSASYGIDESVELIERMINQYPNR